jgi:SAM-dependent methyltransferase
VTESGEIRAFYTDNPRMVSSPFGGVDDFDTDLLGRVFEELRLDVSGKTIVDVGCGRGFARDWVIAQGGQYLGVDFVVSRTGFPLAQADAARLPLASESVDMIWCIDASEHFPEPEAVTRELFRVLRPGGSFFLSAPNYSNVAGLVKSWMERTGRYAPRTWAPFGRWQPQELEQPLRPGYVRRLYGNAGFRLGALRGYGPEAGLGLFPWIDHPAMPDRIRFRLQKLFRVVGPPIAQAWPGASLHVFYRFDKPAV